MNSIELMPADPEGWWAMSSESIDPTEWVWGETPVEALERFLQEWHRLEKAKHYIAGLRG